MFHDYLPKDADFDDYYYSRHISQKKYRKQERTHYVSDNLARRLNLLPGLNLVYPTKALWLLGRQVHHTRDDERIRLFKSAELEINPAMFSRQLKKSMSCPEFPRYVYFET